MYAVLAVTTDITHLAAMVLWAVGLPLLFWHRWPRLTLAYTWFALLFVVVSQLSHVVLDECFLTTLSRALWLAAGDPTAGSFSVRLVNAVAGIRPSEESAVLAWEIAIAFTGGAMLWSMHRARSARIARARGAPATAALGGRDQRVSSAG